MRVLAVDGQFLHDLKTEEKGETTLVPPSDFMRLRCYFMLFDLLLKGDYVWVFIDGESGREAIVEYAIEHGGRAGPLTQARLPTSQSPTPTISLATSSHGPILLSGAPTLYCLFPGRKPSTVWTLI